MTIRVQILVHCDEPGCERETEATAELRVTEVAFGLGSPPQYGDIVVPPKPDGSDTGRGQWAGRQLCPEHAPNEDAQREEGLLATVTTEEMETARAAMMRDKNGRAGFFPNDRQLRLYAVSMRRGPVGGRAPKEGA